jgi:hypothetical protein
MPISSQDMLALRLNAMHAVLAEDADYTLRFICRWYSERYNTPLHLVATPEGVVDLEEVLQTFYETRYAQMTDPEKEKEIALLLRTPEEERAEARKADQDEAENWGFAKMIERQVHAKKAKEAKAEAKRLEELKLKQQAKIAGDAPQGDRPVGAPVGRPQPPPVQAPRGPRPPQAQGQGNALDAATVDVKKGSMVNTTLPEDVKVVFMTDEEMAKDAACMDPFSVERPKQPRKKGWKPPQSKK